MVSQIRFLRISSSLAIRRALGPKPRFVEIGMRLDLSNVFRHDAFLPGYLITAAPLAPNQTSLGQRDWRILFPPTVVLLRVDVTANRRDSLFLLFLDPIARPRSTVHVTRS